MSFAHAKLTSPPIDGPTQDDVGISIGTVSIRVFVLPPKSGKDVASLKEGEHDRDFAERQSESPMGSYLEQGKGGRRYIVFVVNGQRQDWLDGSFIVDDLGFKYLRNRMMIVVDVDGLHPEAIGRLMQGSRQTFYRGEVWNEIRKRLIATLKRDPDLRRLEERAAERISELKAGDANVRHTLNQLIDRHHERGSTPTSGGQGPNAGDEADISSPATMPRGDVVTLLPPRVGTAAEYPVLMASPSSLRMDPGTSRHVAIRCFPPQFWQSIVDLRVDGGHEHTGLQIALHRGAEEARVELDDRHVEGTNYPLEVVVRVTATFKGIDLPRQVEINVTVAPERDRTVPVLTDHPTALTVAARRPVNVRLGDSDTHVQLRWDGADGLLVSDNPEWRRAARLLTPGAGSPRFAFSSPRHGRFSLLITPEQTWRAGEELTFEVTATGGAGRTLSTTFRAVVSADPRDVEPKGPRVVSSVIGPTTRRPPYDLKLIGREDYETPCWNAARWTDEDAGSYVPPTEALPLVLIINEDMTELRRFREHLTSRYGESHIRQELNRYQSSVAYHLYQMYLASVERTSPEPDLDAADRHRREEIHRVAVTMTLRSGTADH